MCFFFEGVGAGDPPMGAGLGARGFAWSLSIALVCGRDVSWNRLRRLSLALLVAGCPSSCGLLPAVICFDEADKCAFYIAAWFRNKSWHVLRTGAQTQEQGASTRVGSGRLKSIVLKLNIAAQQLEHISSGAGVGA